MGRVGWQERCCLEARGCDIHIHISTEQVLPVLITMQRVKGEKCLSKGLSPTAACSMARAFIIMGWAAGPIIGPRWGGRHFHLRRLTARGGPSKKCHALSTALQPISPPWPVEHEPNSSWWFLLQASITCLSSFGLKCHKSSTWPHMFYRRFFWYNLRLFCSVMDDHRLLLG